MRQLSWTVTTTEEESLTEELFERGFSAIATEPLESGLIRVSLFLDDSLFETARAELRAITRASWTVTDYTGDWKNAWCDSTKILPSIVIEDKLTIYPDSANVPPAEPGEIRVIVNPQDTFGYGSHPSSRLALEAMIHQHERFPGAAVLDFGTGSGVLALVAARLGAESVVAVDNDSCALERAAQNSRANDISSIACRDQIPDSPEYFDIIIANIPVDLLEATIGSLLRRARKSSLLIISGYLETAEARVLEWVSEWEVLEICRGEGWGALAARR